MKKLRIGLSAGEFYRAVQLHYYCLYLTKDCLVSIGEIIVLEITGNVDIGVNCSAVVREVVDWDCVDYMDNSKQVYQVIVRNNNYFS